VHVNIREEVCRQTPPEQHFYVDVDVISVARLVVIKILCIWAPYDVPLIVVGDGQLKKLIRSFPIQGHTLE
jgi:hypothetical protein